MPNTAKHTVATETWRPVTGYLGAYEVSDLGRVRSVDRIVQQRTSSGKPGTSSRRGRILKPPLDKDGYVTAGLVCCGKLKLRKVHAMVLESFVGPRPLGLVACHGDGDPTNNTPSNLRWDTISANTYDKIDHGRHHMVNKVVCKRGHLLTEPNLILADLARGHRCCRACHLTYSWGRHRHISNDHSAWQIEADRRYAEILHFGCPLRYSRTGQSVRWTPITRQTPRSA